MSRQSKRESPGMTPWFITMAVIIAWAAHANYYTAIALDESDKETNEMLMQEMMGLQNQLFQTKLSLWRSRDQLREYHTQLEADVLKPNATTLPLMVERRENPTIQEFWELAMVGKPVIITGLKNAVTSDPSQFLNQIVSRCGNAEAPLFRHDSRSQTWGGLEHAHTTTLKDVVAKFEASKQSSQPFPFYLHDWSLPHYCPGILNDIHIPRYFGNDYLQRGKIRSHDTSHVTSVPFRNDWPSLFIGPRGTQSGLHVDSFGSNFWMMLLEGKKKWIIFPRSERIFLYEDRSKNAFMVNPEQLLHPTTPPMETKSTNAKEDGTARYPLFSRTHPAEFILVDGKFLFFPAGSPHQVIKLEDTVEV
eukprot:TRINITY_DN246_c0_g1::TRINITY_DN246_c0_g1_i1::g.1681::m.1681 TRINITY_DN246_c0_g1::TRINITY_DN246_c0_g1_i1::g.1681  ORF type:complete len:376 (-),score=-4.29,sp/Q08BY5/JMJD4_DANRE/27.55/5e-12,Cupin_8/PF13621.1/2.4e-19,JmjC/PF02373.17/2.7e+03,JmjC/PF02373.17/8.7e+02,JmjC/PF02373.17/0.00015 TRINITY_DN246_c0_g1_i1:435-1520(-)